MHISYLIFSKESQHVSLNYSLFYVICVFQSTNEKKTPLHVHSSVQTQLSSLFNPLCWHFAASVFLNCKRERLETPCPGIQPAQFLHHPPPLPGLYNSHVAQSVIKTKQRNMQWKEGLRIIVCSSD